MLGIYAEKCWRKQSPATIVKEIQQANCKLQDFATIISRQAYSLKVVLFDKNETKNNARSSQSPVSTTRFPTGIGNKFENPAMLNELPAYFNVFFLAAQLCLKK